VEVLQARMDECWADVDAEAHAMLAEYERVAPMYRDGELKFEIRGKELTQPTSTKSLANSDIPRVATPQAHEHDAGTLLKWLRKENLPGYFPFTAGVFPLKRTDEEPKRQFAGEGPAKRTNDRFHYLSADDPAKRLSTAFDSVTLYGRDPSERPDIYGKVGNSGVSIFSVDEMGQLFEGFDLCHPSTSVSMTINGPAPTVLAFFFVTAIRQQLAQFKEAEGRDANDEEKAAIRESTLTQVRLQCACTVLRPLSCAHGCTYCCSPLYVCIC
jgi:methylmalonyl-CoA mutase